MQSFQDFKNSVKKSRKAVHSTPENGVKKKKSIALPKEPLNLIRGMTTKEKECIGNKEAHVIASFYNSGQGINPIAKNGITANNVYAGKGIGIGIFE